jgi:hypothetical protein
MLESKEDMSIEPKNVDLILINKSVDGGLVGGLSDTLFNNMKVNIGDTLSLKNNEDNILYTINNLNTNITNGVHYKGHGVFKIMFIVEAEAKIYALKIFEKNVGKSQFNIKLYNKLRSEYGDHIPIVYKYGNLQFTRNNGSKGECSYFIEEICKTLDELKEFKGTYNYNELVNKFCKSMFKCLKLIYDAGKIHSDMRLSNIGYTRVYVSGEREIVFKLIDYDEETIYEPKPSGLFGMLFGQTHLNLILDGIPRTLSIGMPYNENQLNFGSDASLLINIQFLKNKEYIKKAWVVDVYCILLYFFFKKVNGEGNWSDLTISDGGSFKNSLYCDYYVETFRRFDAYNKISILLDPNYDKIPSLDEFIDRLNNYINMDDPKMYDVSQSYNKDKKIAEPSKFYMFSYMYVLFIMVSYIILFWSHHFSKLLNYILNKIPIKSKFHSVLSYILKNNILLFIINNLVKIILLYVLFFM